VATVLGSVVALTLWALAAEPEAPPYMAELRELPAWVAVLGVVGFALVNPIWEEALYRGVLLTELMATVGTWPALVIQAVSFGLAHLHGFPSGWIGVLLAGGWGLMLGIIRVRSGGIGLTYVTHFCANATIGILAVAILR
jgi:membrane protease YdiL (CAAX protease family)